MEHCEYTVKYIDTIDGLYMFIYINVYMITYDNAYTDSITTHTRYTHLFRCFEVSVALKDKEQFHWIKPSYLEIFYG